MSKLPLLEQLLKYDNPRVIKMYQRLYPNNKMPAKQAQCETLKYLWLEAKHAIERKNNPTDDCLNFMCVMLSSMREIDNYWHEFILYTEDYHEFCNQYFGSYVHHKPNVFENEPMDPAEIEEQTVKLLSYVYDNLGEETMYTWYHDYMKN